MIVLILLLGILFYALDKYHYPCKKKVSLYHNLLHYVHNTMAILVYLGPFLFTDNSILYILMGATILLLFQGLVNPNKKQSCILMPIYNKECGIEKDRKLYDIFSVLQIKQRMLSDDFNLLYYAVHASLLVYIIMKIK
jgi:hypothetical protein